jgi:flavodoxin
MMAAETVLTPGAKILICWFTRTGLTKRVVGVLQPILHADLYEIRTDITYTGIIGGLRSIIHSIGGKEQQVTGALPDVSQYDIFVVACPIWNFKPPPPVSAFLAAVNFNGKPIIGLSTCTSKMGEFLDKLQSEVVNGRLIRKDSFYDVGRKTDVVLAETVNQWLVGL